MEARNAVQAAMRALLDAAGADARSAWCRLPGGRLHHLEAGTGPPVVLLHGGTGGGANWFRMIAPLARSFRVLAPDLPGFGLSDVITPRAPLGRAAADVLRAWLERADAAGALVVGTSFGGLAALRLAAEAPGLVARLLLLDSAGLGRGIHPLLRVPASRGMLALAVRPSRRGTRFLFEHLLTHDRSDMSAREIDALLEYLYVSAVHTDEAHYAATLRLFTGVRGQREVPGGDELRQLRLPVSIVWGERDRLLPVRHAHRAARRMPHAGVRTLEGIGHSPNWEAPGEVLAAIDELARRPAPDLA